MFDPVPIERSQLVKAVEAGIEGAATVLTTAEKMALRSVAATADQVARGCYTADGCGCPLTQVGLNPAVNRDVVGGRLLSAFYQPFDRTTKIVVGPTVSLLKVVGD